MQRKDRKIPKIAVFIDSLVSGYHQHIWKQIQREMLVRKISVQCFCVGIFEHSHEFLFERNKTFELSSFGRPDAGIVFSNLVGTTIGEQETIRKIRKALHIPLVSVGAECSDTPSVLLDNNSGVMEIVEHAAVDHGYSHMLVINGPAHNSDANERKYAIVRTLRQYDVDIDNDVYSIEWDYANVQDCISRCLNILRLKPVDVIFAFDDEVAIYISDAMERNGFESKTMPAIFGFNNIPEYIRVFPGLTTVNQPLDRLVEKSFDLCLDLVDKRIVPSVTRVPSGLVIRTSCGCSHWKDDGAGRSKRTFQHLERAVSSIFMKTFKNAMTTEWEKISVQIFFRALYKDIVSGIHSELTVDVFRDLVSESSAAGIGESIWEEFINEIERFLENKFISPVREVRKNDLLYKLRDALNNICEFREIAVEQSRAMVLIERKFLSEGFLTATSYDELAGDLTRRLLQLSTPAFSIFLEDNDSWPNTGDMLISAEAQGNDMYSIRFEKRVPGIVFAEFAEKQRRSAPLLVMALYHRETFFGYAFFEAANRDSSFYEAVCSQISHVINSIRQMAQIHHHTENLEDKVRERTTILNRAMNELEAAYRQLKNIDDIKNDFILNITHDFRSPLTVINNLAELSLMDGDELDPDVRENFDLIYTSGVQLKKYIDQLLDLSRIDAKGIKLIVSGIHLNSFLERLADFYNSSVAGSGIQVGCSVPDDDVYVYTDAVKLEDILHNIVSNAVKFVNNDGGRIDIALTVNDEKVLIAIRDNGVGIDEQHLELIFKRFEKFDKTAKVKQRSTGIGLSYAAQLVDIMNGRIWAESAGRNLGSVFYIELPVGSEHFVKELLDYNRHELDLNREIEKILKYDIQQKENAMHDQKVVEIKHRNAEGEFDYKKALILIVEDDLNIRRIIHDFLTHDNYQNFLLASNGREALELFDEYKPDIVISDLNMPLLRGDELYDELLEKTDGGIIPFIFLSAIGDQQISVKQKEKGALAYLKKPIDKKELLEIVNRHMESLFK